VKPYDKERRGQETSKLHPSKLRGKTRENEKENKFPHFPIVTDVACEILAGSDPVTRKQVRKRRKKRAEKRKEKKRTEVGREESRSVEEYRSSSQRKI
jgi:hypothetical protein